MLAGRRCAAAAALRRCLRFATTANLRAIPCLHCFILAASSSMELLISCAVIRHYKFGCAQNEALPVPLEVLVLSTGWWHALACFWRMAGHCGSYYTCNGHIEASAAEAPACANLCWSQVSKILPVVLTCHVVCYMQALQYCQGRRRLWTPG